jgi:hypothetical protein
MVRLGNNATVPECQQMPMVRYRTDRLKVGVRYCPIDGNCALEKNMDLLIIVIVLLLVFGGGGGLYWGMGAGWGIGPIGLIIAVLVVAYLVNGYRGRRGPRL